MNCKNCERELTKREIQFLPDGLCNRCFAKREMKKIEEYYQHSYSGSNVGNFSGIKK